MHTGAKVMNLGANVNANKAHGLCGWGRIPKGMPRAPFVWQMQYRSTAFVAAGAKYETADFMPVFLDLSRLVLIFLAFCGRF